MHYLLFYEKAADYAERQPAVYPAHRDHVRAALKRVELILGGPLQEPADGSNVLLFRAAASATVENFAKADPYVTGGVVARWHVRPWQTVVGKEAESPMADFKID